MSLCLLLFDLFSLLSKLKKYNTYRKVYKLHVDKFIINWTYLYNQHPDQEYYYTNTYNIPLVSASSH